MADYSTGYQFKLIGTGEEAGTWGSSTNRNLQKIEAAIGRAVDIDITNPPILSSFTTGPPDVLNWLTKEDSATSESGSEGRCSYVVFTNTLAVSAIVNVNIGGNSLAEKPGRTFIVKNGLSSPNTEIRLSIGTTSYSLRNGSTVEIFTSAGDIDGSGTNAVVNALGSIQLEGLDLRDSASAKIYVSPSQVNALSVNDGTDDRVILDTANSKLIIKGGTTAATVEVSGTDKDLELKSGATNSDVILSPQGTGKVTLTSGNFVGNLTGDITGDLAGYAAKVQFQTATGTQLMSVVLGPIAAGPGIAQIDPDFNYQPTLQILSVPNVITDSVSGTSSGLTVESAGTLTVESPILTSPTIAASDFTLAQHSHSDADSGGLIPDTARGAGTITNITMPLDDITSVGEGAAAYFGYAYGSIGKYLETAHNVTSPVSAHAFLRYKGPGTAVTGIPNIGDYGWSVGDRLPILSTNSIGKYNYSVLLSDSASGGWGWNATHVWLVLGPLWGTAAGGGVAAEDTYAADGTGAQRFFATMARAGSTNPNLDDPNNPTGIDLRISQCIDWEIVISVVG